jgi:hypothetical protein
MFTRKLLVSLTVVVAAVCQFGGGVDHCAALVLSSGHNDGVEVPGESKGCCDSESCPESHLGGCCQPMPGLLTAVNGTIAEPVSPVIHPVASKFIPNELESGPFHPPSA